MSWGIKLAAFSPYPRNLMIAGARQITILQGSLLEVEAELIVNPGKSYGLMGGGVAGVIRCIAGRKV